MRIKRLAITGFGPYKDRQVVDFEGFENDGLFLITGKTGAGKSSILDAICFALYGTIPRYEGTQQKLRSDHCEPDDATAVELEFTVDDLEYRIIRSPEYERPKARGIGMTPQKATAELSVRRDGEWEAFAARPVDVAPEIARIIGLSKEQFLQVILLAQNRFQDFLLSRSEERQKVLRSLFGTRRFEELELALGERRKSLETRVGAARETLAQEAARAQSLLELEERSSEPDLEWFNAGLASLTRNRDLAGATAERAHAEFTAADSAQRALQTVRSLQSRRDEMSRRLSTLETQRERIAIERSVIAAARRAEAVWAHVSARHAADESLLAATSAEAEARAKFVRYGVSIGPAESPTASIDEVTRELGTLDAVLAEEKTLAGTTREIADLRKRSDAKAKALGEATERVASLPVRLDELGTRIGAAQVEAAGEDDASERVARVEASLTAAARIIELADKHRAALRAEERTTGEHSVAAARIHELMRKRLAGHAAELAAQLTDGKACMVCGSTNHPSPASGNDTAVTEEDVEHARATTEKSRVVMDFAHARTTELGTRLTEERTKAGNRSVDDIDAELVVARERLQIIQDAAARLPALAAERNLLRSELAEAASKLDNLRGEKDDAAHALVDKQSRRASIEERIEQHRAGFDTILDRVEQLKRRLAAALALSDALGLVASRAETATAAVSTLETHLAENGFADEAAAASAKLDLAALASAEARVRTFDDGILTASATLAEPEMATLPTEPVRLEPAEEALASARSARDAAMSARSSALARLDQLGTVVASARRQLASSAALLDEHRQLRELANAVEGREPNEKRMRLETYVLAARLEEIVAAANARLRTMTSGRYTLEHDDALQFRGVRSGLALAIRDEHSGRARATQSLSGGETFLASLALALGLAEVVTNQTGGMRLDTLFIDEGFGSLDSDTLEIAMSTLDSLRAGGRTIGLISHVDAMKEQIPAKLRITVGDRGWSRIEPSYEEE